MHTPIMLKPGTHKGLIKANFGTNFGWNPMEIYGIMTDYSSKED